MLPSDNTTYYDGFHTEYNINMNPTTSYNAQSRLSLDSGLGLTNDTMYSSDLNETQLMDISAATASETSAIFQSTPLESSPPTKWARIRTPPNRKKKDEHQHHNQELYPSKFKMFSPPSQKKIRTLFTSPTSSLKTPESLRKSIRISSPSPFKVTFSKTPLKLSNNENVTGIHIGRSGTYYNKKITGKASKRCLLPSMPDGFTLLGSPNSDVLDVPLQTNFDGFEDLPIETPSKINASLEVGDDSMDYLQYAGMVENSSSLNTYTHSSGPLIESHVKSLKKTPLTRSASRNLLKSSSGLLDINDKKHSLDSDAETSKKEPLPDPKIVETERDSSASKKELIIKSEIQSIKEAMLKQAKEKEMKVWKMAPFETPRKDVPLYSGRWLVISTGRTLAQQELFSDAKEFFLRHCPPLRNTTNTPTTRRTPTISRVALFSHRYRSLRF